MCSGSLLFGSPTTRRVGAFLEQSRQLPGRPDPCQQDTIVQERHHGSSVENTTKSHDQSLLDERPATLAQPTPQHINRRLAFDFRFCVERDIRHLCRRIKQGVFGCFGEEREDCPTGDRRRETRCMRSSTHEDGAKKGDTHEGHEGGGRHGSDTPTQPLNDLDAEENDDAGTDTDDGAKVAHESLVVERIWVLLFQETLPHDFGKIDGQPIPEYQNRHETQIPRARQKLGRLPHRQLGFVCLFGSRSTTTTFFLLLFCGARQILGRGAVQCTDRATGGGRGEGCPVHTLPHTPRATGVLDHELTRHDGGQATHLGKEGIEAFRLIDPDHVIGKGPEQESDGDTGVDFSNDIKEGGRPVGENLRDDRGRFGGANDALDCCEGGVQDVRVGKDTEVEQEKKGKKGEARDIE